MHLLKTTFLFSIFILLLGCCPGGDNIATSRLLEEEVSFLPYSAVFATAFNYYYSKTDDTLSFVYNRPVREIHDRRNGAESCNV